MKWSILNVPLGLTDPARSKRAGWEEALIGMAAGSFASFLDSQNIENTNAANERNVFRTNEANKEINQQQIAWAREKYEQEKVENRFLVDQAYQRELENRAYNSPAALKQRYLQAGINPYLAMYGSGASGGSVGSFGSSVGSPPKYDNPSMIPMQTGAPLQAYTGFGKGIRDSMATALSFMANERQDYALASQIEVEHMNARANLITAAAAARKAGVDEKWVDHQMMDSNRQFQFSEDKFEVQNDLNQAYLNLEERKTAVQEAELELKSIQTEYGLRLSNTQCNYLAQLIVQSASEIKVSEQNAQAYGSLVANEVVHMLNQDADAFQRLGMDREMVSSRKFANYVGSVADGLWTAAGLFFGIRSGKAPVSIKGFGR